MDRRGGLLWGNHTRENLEENLAGHVSGKRYGMGKPIPRRFIGRQTQETSVGRWPDRSLWRSVRTGLGDEGGNGSEGVTQRRRFQGGIPLEVSSRH